MGARRSAFPSARRAPSHFFNNGRDPAQALSAPQARAAVSEVADYASLGRSEVHQSMETVELPHIEIGKCRRVRWDDVQSLLAEKRVGRP